MRLRRSGLLLFVTLCLLQLLFLMWRQQTGPRERTFLIEPSHRRCHVFTEEIDSDSFLLGNLNTVKGSVTIAVFSADDLISRSILQNGSWEPRTLVELQTVLAFDPSLQLIDVGANLGVYSLVAAAFGRKVVAVDANRAMAARLHLSARLNGFGRQVTVVWNAVSDVRRIFSLITPDNRNVGHSWLGPKDALQGGPEVRSLLLDDLLEVVDFRRAILKIDIEGHEVEAISGAARLFSTIHIPTVLMEWRWVAQHQNHSGARAVLRFFRHHGYAPFDRLLSDVQLNISDFLRWPWDIVWKKMM